MKYTHFECERKLGRDPCIEEDREGHGKILSAMWLRREDTDRVRFSFLFRNQSPPLTEQEKNFIIYKQINKINSLSVLGV